MHLSPILDIWHRGSCEGSSKGRQWRCDLFPQRGTSPGRSDQGKLEDWQVDCARSDQTLVSRLQREETRRRPCLGILQENREYRRCEGYEIPGVDARHSALAGDKEDRQNVEYEQVRERCSPNASDTADRTIA